MRFTLGEHGEMVEMFAPCPKCKVQYMIIYEDGAKLCSYCGYHCLEDTANVD